MFAAAVGTASATLAFPGRRLPAGLGRVPGLLLLPLGLDRRFPTPTIVVRAGLLSLDLPLLLGLGLTPAPFSLLRHLLTTAFRLLAPALGHLRLTGLLLAPAGLCPATPLGPLPGGLLALDVPPATLGVSRLFTTGLPIAVFRLLPAAGLGGLGHLLAASLLPPALCVLAPTFRLGLRHLLATAVTLRAAGLVPAIALIAPGHLDAPLVFTVARLGLGALPIGLRPGDLHPLRILAIPALLAPFPAILALG